MHVSGCNQNAKAFLLSFHGYPDKIQSWLEEAEKFAITYGHGEQAKRCACQKTRSIIIVPKGTGRVNCVANIFRCSVRLYSKTVSDL